MANRAVSNAPGRLSGFASAAVSGPDKIERAPTGITAFVAAVRRVDHGENAMGAGGAGRRWLRWILRVRCNGTRLNCYGDGRRNSNCFFVGADARRQQLGCGHFQFGIAVSLRVGGVGDDLIVKRN